MDLAAIIIVGARPEEGETARNDRSSGVAAEVFAGIPIALLDLLGKSVAHHVVDRLHRAGVEAVTALSSEGACEEANDPQLSCLPANELWRAAEEAFCAYASEGVESVLLLRLGPYGEVDLDPLLRFHSERRQNATVIYDQGRNPLDAAIVQAARRTDALFLIRNGLRSTRLPSEPYIVPGYVNRLENTRDLRRLAQDALLMRCEIQPQGREIKPGVWIGEHARIHRTARVLAPAFVGTRAKLRAASVVTRCSVVEHHAEVDCGTVLEDTTVLPYTYVGAGLDASHAVAGFGRLVHLRRDAEVEITDARLLGTVSVSAAWRTLKSAASLAAYLPVQAVRGVVQRGHRSQSAAVPQADAEIPSPPPQAATLEPSSEPLSASNQGPQFGGDFAVVRRYGNE
jgi:carbonic anhydrase/acetyltransferase-like protein (isoleucine patch superfamily)